MNCRLRVRVMGGYHMFAMAIYFLLVTNSKSLFEAGYWARWAFLLNSHGHIPGEMLEKKLE